MNNLSERIANLSPQKLELYSQLLKQRAESGPGTDRSIPRRPPGMELPPLSFAQQRLWFLHQMEPESPFYNCVTAVRLSGVLNQPALERSINEIVRRHEVLRTTIATGDGKAVQRIAAHLEIQLQVTDLTCLAPAEADVRRLAEMEAEKPFDLNTGPLLRVSLFNLAEQDSLVLLISHHIVSDAWSKSILARELTALYAAFSTGQSPSLPELPIQYADFAVWQRGFLSGTTLENQLSYWREQLHGTTGILDLPTDYRRPAQPRFHGAQRGCRLEAKTVTGLKELGARHGATLFMVVMAALYALLHRHSGQEDIIVGVPISNRTRREIKDLIGFFINALPMRVQVTPTLKFEDLLKQIKDVALGAYAHQEVPFEMLVNEVQLARDLSRNPLFQVIAIFQNTPRSEAKFSGLEMKPFEIGIEKSQYDLSFVFEETAEAMTLLLEYDTDLFAAAGIERLLEHFRAVIEHAAQAPATRIGDLPLLSQTELTLLRQWNDTATDSLTDISIPELFERQAQLTPQARAVEHGRDVLTCAELNRLSNQVAHYLRAQGVQAESRVGCCLERSPQMIVALLGILKAGAAYIPLDPKYPRQRLAYMIEDSGAEILLTQESLGQLLPDVDLPKVNLDSGWSEIAEHDEKNLPLTISGANAAVIIYTSGSTGTPKGVLCTHAGAINRFQWMWQNYAFLPGDVCAQRTSLSFVDSIWEIFGPLLKGVSLVMLSDQALRDVELMKRQLWTNQITRIVLVPSLLAALLADEHGEDLLAGVRLWVTSGEAISLELWEKFRRKLDRARLLNLYGSSEVAADVTFYELAGDIVSRNVPIGRAIDNMQVHLLDQRLGRVPVGVVGEIYVGGIGLARGYVNQPGLTAERFVPHPYSESGGERLYRTGDLGRYDQEGNIEFLGRCDHQVKIRGYRIELPEIEAALLDHAEVRQAVVVARVEADGSRRLVGYYVGHVGVSELREHLRARLPEYMIPAVLVELESIPLTPSGKVDRRRLPEPGAERPGLAAAYAAPETEVEKELARIWSEVLGVERAGIHDNFFELGGDSILGVQVVAKARKVGWWFTSKHIFEHQTLGALAAAAVPSSTVKPSASGPSKTAERFALARMDEQTLRQIEQSHPRLADIYPLTPMQLGMLFHTLGSPDSGVYVEQWSCVFEGSVQPAKLARAIRRVIERHDILRTSFLIDGVPQPVQLVHEEVEFRLAELDWSGKGEEERRAELEQYLEQERRKGFDLGKAPLARATLIRESEERQVLVWTHHHLLLDGWSLPLLLEELLENYEAEVQGREVKRVEERPYREYLEWLGRQDREGAEQYWRQELAGWREVTRLGIERRVEGAVKWQYERAEQRLDAALSRQVEEWARREQLTLNTMVQGAWALLLSRYSGTPEVVFGVTVSGRPAELAGIERMVGLFINTLPLRVELREEEEVASWLRRLQQRQAVQREYEYSSLAEVQGWSEVGRGEALFESIVVFENYPVSKGRRAGAATETQRGKSEELRIGEAEFRDTTNYPLTLGVIPGDELQLRLSYNSERYEREAMERLLSHLVQVLAGMTAGGKLREVPMLSAAEVEQQVREWNDTRRAVGHETMVGLFERQVRERGAATALKYGEAELSYEELNRRANRLGRQLRELGVGAEVRVGLALERGPEMVIALLAVLKAGGVYVPLDAEYPGERLSYMLKDAGVALVLTEAKVAERLPAYGVPMLKLEEMQAELSGQSEANLPGEIRGENLAYIIYTSGSTGKPKGVMISHAGMRNLVDQQIAAFQITPESSVLQFASLSFDASVSEVFTALGAGATLCLLNGEEMSSPEALLHSLRGRRITTATLPPALLEVMPVSDLPQLATLVTAGEACSAEIVIRWSNGRTFINAYGPTEATVCASVMNVTNGVGPNGPPIGRPIGNTQVYLLDKQLRPAPRGAVSEIFIGGAGLARGYVNQPALTAERFVPHPYSESGGERLYRTGDLGRYDEEGNIEFLGRCDHQVKIRGYRIELQEIEAVLLDHPEVRQAVVARAEGSRRLVGYYVGRIGVSELREHLQQRLPEYMIPAVLVELDHIPLTANGKVDRRRLPEPGAHRPELAAEYAAPETGVERELARIWSEVLGVERAGIHDNFFALGGDSILSIQVVARARQSGLQFTPRDIFAHPTIKRLASVAGELAPSMAQQDEVVGEVPLTPIQRWFFSTQQGNAHFNQTFLLRFTRPVHSSWVLSVLDALLSQHDALRLRFVSKEDGIHQIHSPSSSELTRASLATIDLQNLPRPLQEKALLKTAGEANKSFDLERGPMFCLVLYDLGPERGQRLLLAAHHLVVDGVSWRILLEDLELGLAQASRGLPVQFGPKPTSYKEWAEQLARYAAGEEVAGEREYWAEQDLETGIHLSDASSNLVSDEDEVVVSLEADETRELLQDVPEIYRTQINEVLLTALSEALHRWNGEQRVRIEMEGHGREEQIAPGLDLTRTVGWFTNMYPVTVDCSDSKNDGARNWSWSVAERIRKVKDHLRGIPNHGLGYMLLNEIVPAIQQQTVSFNYLGQVDRGMSARGWFAPAEEQSGKNRGDDVRRTNALEITGMVSGARLQMRWGFNRNRHRNDEIRQVAQWHLEALREIVESTKHPSQAQPRYVPSDFPQMNFTQDELDELVADIVQID